MGAWGFGPFDNDTAADWSWLVTDAGSDGEALDVIETALRRVSGSSRDDYLGVDAAMEAIAAAALVAAAMSGDRGDLPDEIAEWVLGNHTRIPARIAPLAKRALDRIEGRNSEFAELCAESRDEEHWRRSLRSIAQRLAVA